MLIRILKMIATSGLLTPL